MKSEQEKLREMLIQDARPEGSGAAGEHLRDKDFIRLIVVDSADQTEFSTNTNGNSFNVQDNLTPLRTHLADCASCLAEFRDFYAFYAPVQENEHVAGKAEIEAAWNQFVPRIGDTKPITAKEKPNFWARLFPAERKTNYSGALGWGVAALLLLSSVVSIFIAYETKNENSQLAAQIENQKRISEERLKMLEQTVQNNNIAEQEKSALAAEKDDLQKEIAKLQTELERAKQPIAMGELTPPNDSGANSLPETDNSLIAVNTPIYDVFPADSSVRGNENDKNSLVIPKEAKSIVLILNAAGSAEFQTYRAELFSNSGASLWRGAGLKKDNLGNFTFTISRAALKTGIYRLRLFGKNDDAPLQPITEYTLTVSSK